MKDLMPGDRVIVFDSILYKDDFTTPLTHTMKAATIVCRYGRKDPPIGEDYPERTYDDLCDVVFDHRKDSVSKGHFTYGIKRI